MKHNCRKKPQRKANMRDMLKLISGMSPCFLPFTILEALLSTAVVFINIILSADSYFSHRSQFKVKTYLQN